MSVTANYIKWSLGDSFAGRLKRNLSFQVGAIIVTIYLIISLLDFIDPKYLGVSNAFNLFSFSNPGIRSVLMKQPSPPTTNEGLLYLLGTTAYGIPILPAILASIPVDLGFAVLIAGVSATIGTFIGVSGAFLTKKLEWVISFVSNTFISIPIIISVLIFGFLLHFTLFAISIGIIAVLWAYYAQIARMLTLNIKGNQFIEAARASGASDLRIVYSHVFPNIATPVLIRFSLDIATVIMIFSATNFLFWQQFTPLATTPELGALINGFPEFGYLFGFHLVGSQYIPATASLFLYMGYWWTVFFPVLFLLILVIGLIALSDGMRKALDPRTT